MFLIFGLAFAAVMTSANQAAHASDPSFYGKELSSLFHSIESLYWTLFGMRGLTSYETNLGEETTLLRVFVGTWLLVGAVILLTVLTGLVASNFQNVYDNAENEWKCMRAIFISDLEPEVIFPLPFACVCMVEQKIQSSFRAYKEEAQRKRRIHVKDDELPLVAKEQVTTGREAQVQVDERIREVRGKNVCIRSDIDEVLKRLTYLEENLEKIFGLLKEIRMPKEPEEPKEISEPKTQKLDDRGISVIHVGGLEVIPEEPSTSDEVLVHENSQEASMSLIPEIAPFLRAYSSVGPEEKKWRRRRKISKAAKSRKVAVVRSEFSSATRSVSADHTGARKAESSS
ncbi:short transient receptor potential channel 6-like [Oscarella lobularis]|uniref:short transient receptor potential channel 6-like n=1 Tax=Oscarella lobularis TaxID=121494 RepID=UPI00331330D7